MERALTELHRFMEKVLPVPGAGCWLWEGFCRPTGYGQFWMRGADYKAHRASWLLHHGAIPPEQSVLHKCDTPACVNPDHLFLGTQADNMADMKAKGRSLNRARQQGSPRKGAKLTPEQVRAIRGDCRSTRKIALDYSLDSTTVSAIKRRAIWALVA